MSLIPKDYYSKPEKFRWTLCASDRCFKYKALSHLFTAAKVLPIVRGKGLDQAGMVAAKKRLAVGDWVHVFPEGTRSKDGHSLGLIRKGVGSLVASAAGTSSSPSIPHLPPLVIPFYHEGMQKVLPRGQLLPSIGQRVRVIIGEPIDMKDLYQLAKLKGWTADKLHTAVASRISFHLEMLKMRLEAADIGTMIQNESASLSQQGAVSDLSDIYDVIESRPPRPGERAIWKEDAERSISNPKPSSSLFPAHTLSMLSSIAMTRFFSSYARERESQIAQFFSM